MPDLLAFRKLSIEDLLLPVLVQLIVIIVAARVFAALCRRLGQPAVIGEIAAGLLLGPSLLGAVYPAGFTALFRPSLPNIPQELTDAVVPKIFAIISQIGLILLLFFIGLEVDFLHLKARGKAALAISFSGVIFPFGLGLGLAWFIHPLVAATHDRLGFMLFLGVATSITAIPVLGRMLMEWGVTRTTIGAVTISSAAINDAVGWILLASVAATVRTGFDAWDTVQMVGLTLAFGAVMYFGARPILRWWLTRTLRERNGQLGATPLALVLALLFGCAIATNLIGIFAIFGAFVLGAVLSEQTEFREAISRQLHDFVTAFFMPIFFTYTGLRTEITSLETTELWLICGLVITIAIVGKFVGCGVAAWLSGFPKREAALIGTLMNTRGLMELIVINAGYDLGVIPRSVFCMLVLMALVTTVMTTPLVMRLMPGTELEQHIRKK